MRNIRLSRSRFRGHALVLGPLLFLLAAPAWPCTTNVNTGFQGQTIPGNFIMEILPTGSTVSVSPAAGVSFVNQRNPSGTRVFFDVVIDTNATPGGRTVICTFPSGATVTTPNGFTVLAQPTPTPTVTPTAPPPTPTPTPTATPPGATPTATPPGATPTPTRTPAGPPPSGSLEVAPDTIAGGGRRLRIVIAGSGFDASTRVSPSADVSIEGQRIISDTRLEILVSTAPGVPPGPRLFSVFNGPTPLGTVIVTVIPPVSLGAPLSVMTAAIVFPRPGSILAPDEELFARAILAVTGTGVVIGAWEIDGAPFERFEAYASGGEPVTIESKVPIPIHAEGDHFLRLAIEHPQFAVTEMVRIVRLSAHAARLRLVEPSDGAEARRRLRFRWTLVPGAQAYEIVFSREQRELPDSPVFRSVRAFWTPTAEDWRALGEGAWFWAVRPILPVDVRGALSRWRRIVLPQPRDALGPPPRGSPKALGFLLAALQQTTPRVPEAEEETEEEEDAAVADWKLDVTANATVNSGSDPGEEDVAHLALSSASSILADTWSLEETVDFAGHHQVDPQTTTQDSRSWIIGAEAGGRWNAAGTVGYSPPTIGEGTQLLNPGLVRGGAEVRLGTPFGKFSGYGSFDNDLEALFTSTYGSEQRLRLAAYDAPLPGPKLLLRGIYLEAEEQPDDFFGFASSAKAYGGLFRWTASPAFSVSLEAARSESEDEGEEDSRGEAIRLSLQGKSGRTAYSLNLHDTDAEFANPANRGLTAAGQPDRIGGDVGLSHAFGKVWLGISYRHLEADAAGAESRSDAGQLTLTAPLSRRVQINASGLWTGDRGDGSPSGIGPFPRLDRVQYGGRLTLTETLGLLQVSQNLGWTRFDDRVSRVNDVETRNASLTVNGGLHRNLMLAVSAAFTRSERALTGNNDNLVLHIQPRWTLPALRLSLLPRATYSRSESDASRFAGQGEQYQALLEWRPFRPGAFEAVLGVSGDWSRSRFGPADPGFTRRYTGTLSIRWGVGVSSGEPAAAPASLDSLSPAAPLSSRIASMARARHPAAATAGWKF